MVFANLTCDVAMSSWLLVPRVQRQTGTSRACGACKSLQVLKVNGLIDSSRFLSECIANLLLSVIWVCPKRPRYPGNLLVSHDFFYDFPHLICHFGGTCDFQTHPSAQLGMKISAPCSSLVSTMSRHATDMGSSDGKAWQTLSLSKAHGNTTC